MDWRCRCSVWIEKGGGARKKWYERTDRTRRVWKIRCLLAWGDLRPLLFLVHRKVLAKLQAEEIGSQEINLSEVAQGQGH